MKGVNFRVKFVALAAAIILGFSFYLHFTNQITIKNVINTHTIKKIIISTNSSGSLSGVLPKELVLENEQNINEIINILSNYSFKRKLQYINSKTAPINSADTIINFYVYYLDTNNKVVQQYLYVDSENDVVIRNKADDNIEYKLSGKDNFLFGDLSKWLTLNYDPAS